ncbi:type I 3-dehydroquinase-domain-containing protein [Phyllosticta citriasiana]|uniref:Type I 3-dehydroquinase-domain-containing protein n=2 Tax=Phyllosticta citriasiana TaxID=595635 RepID=A0ABR1KHM3_9PEZI
MASVPDLATDTQLPRRMRIAEILHPAMATTRTHTDVNKNRGVVHVESLLESRKPSLLVVHGPGEQEILQLVASVLGQGHVFAPSIADVAAIKPATVVGLLNDVDVASLAHRGDTRILLNVHCVDESAPDERLSEVCDYEYLYTRSPYLRRDLTRFLAFVLGQIAPHKDLLNKNRTTLISTTFPDVHAALPNLDILSVGADAVELRVDLLKEPLDDGSYAPVPSLKYVGKQLMTLRQRTELPIIYTTRCTRENGRFPMDDPALFYKYLYRAKQWGVEYLDVELWLPEEIRRELAQKKGNSKIISAFHDFSGQFKWTSPQAKELFKKGAVYGDVVKMIALVHQMQDNYELEYFRSLITAEHPHGPPFSGLNMSPAGQLSRMLNKVFTPITHPLLPMIAAPGQLSAAEINTALHSMGHMPKLDIYGIGSHKLATQALFFEKCFNELSLPHNFLFVDKAAPPPSRGSASSSSLSNQVEAIVRREGFGGAFINPPLPLPTPYLPTLSDAAKAIRLVDTIDVRNTNGPDSAATLVGENATWKGIRATLTRDFVPSAYSGRAALVLANSETDAAPAVFALTSLDIGPIYTIGFHFRAPGPLAAAVEPFRSVEDVKKLEQPGPFVIVSALPGEKSALVGPLLKHYSSCKLQNQNQIQIQDRVCNVNQAPAGKVFLDLANGPRKVDVMALAQEAGWTAYNIADVNAWTTVETLRLLVGQNVPCDFVRLASGRSLF